MLSTDKRRKGCNLAFEFFVFNLFLLGILLWLQVKNTSRYTPINVNQHVGLLCQWTLKYF